MISRTLRHLQNVDDACLVVPVRDIDPALNDEIVFLGHDANEVTLRPQGTELVVHLIKVKLVHSCGYYSN